VLVTDEIQKASGTLALSFLIQNCVISIYNKNENPSNNKRDLFIAYFLAFLIYSYIGIFGQIGILGKQTSVQNTVMDFFPSDDSFALVIQVWYAVYLALVLPFLVMIARNQFFSLIYDVADTVPNKYEFAFNMSILAICTGCGLFNIDPKILLGYQILLQGLMEL
jgi:hypothetical protein